MNIVIYSTPSCGYCKMAMQYFDKQGIGYQKIDVSDDQTELKKMVDLSGQMGVPVITIGDQVMVGWDKRKFEQEYDSYRYNREIGGGTEGKSDCIGPSE